MGKPALHMPGCLMLCSADILHGLNLKDTNLASHFLGNAIEIVFLEGGTKGEQSLAVKGQVQLLCPCCPCIVL